MQSDNLQRFLASLAPVRWDLGCGPSYDSDALAGIEPGEREDVVQLMAGQLRSGVVGSHALGVLDFLARRGDSSATAVLYEALEHPNPILRFHVSYFLMNMGEPVTPEPVIIETFATGVMGPAMSVVTGVIGGYRSEAVQRAVLECARTGERGARVHAAGLAMFLAGKTELKYDVSLSPLFLRFASRDPDEVARAYAELVERIRAPGG